MEIIVLSYQSLLDARGTGARALRPARTRSRSLGPCAALCAAQCLSPARCHPGFYDRRPISAAYGDGGGGLEGGTTTKTTTTKDNDDDDEKRRKTTMTKDDDD